MCCGLDTCVGKLICTRLFKQNCMFAQTATVAAVKISAEARRKAACSGSSSSSSGAAAAPSSRRKPAIALAALATNVPTSEIQPRLRHSAHKRSQQACLRQAEAASCHKDPPQAWLYIWLWQSRLPKTRLYACHNHHKRPQADARFSQTRTN